MDKRDKAFASSSRPSVRTKSTTTRTAGSQNKRTALSGSSTKGTRVQPSSTRARTTARHTSAFPSSTSANSQSRRSFASRASSSSNSTKRTTASNKTGNKNTYSKRQTNASAYVSASSTHKRGIAQKKSRTNTLKGSSTRKSGLNASLATSSNTRTSRSGILGIIASIFSFIAGLFHALFTGIITLAQRSRLALVVMIIAGLALIGGVVDTCYNWDRVYAGVSVGSIDLSGKTKEEAADIINEAFANALATNEAVVVASEEDLGVVQADGSTADASPSTQTIAAQLVGEGRAWIASADTLAATLGVESMVNEAFERGRSDGGFLTRLSTFFSGYSVTPRANYGADELEAFALTIDNSVSEPRVDYNVAVDAGVAYVTEGHDGTMVDREKLKAKLDTALLGLGSAYISAIPEYAALRIDKASAERTCNALNSALSQQINITAGEYVWTPERADVGSWISTSIENKNGNWVLLPYVDYNLTVETLTYQSMRMLRTTTSTISFARADDGSISVVTDGSGQVPDCASSISLLDNTLLGSVRETIIGSANSITQSSQDAPTTDTSTSEDSVQAASDADISANTSTNVDGTQTDALTISLVTTNTPTSLSFDDALSLDLIQEISTYTTTYLNRETSKNRVHNIHLAADKLNNSIVKANGGRWSFHETAGECNAEAGFLGAGAIVEGEHFDAVGGGICQVATTVFNSVYESGFPVITRHNHTLRMTNYPDGRDAAVSYPDLDLIWENDSTSDVLVCCSYTDTSLTVTLYGVDPGYTVSTKTGDWVEGEAYRTRVECDESMAEGASYVETKGVNGSSISVYRTVSDASGKVIREDTFTSNYDPETEVIVAGPNTKITVGEETLVATPNEPQTSKKITS